MKEGTQEAVLSRECWIWG